MPAVRKKLGEGFIEVDGSQFIPHPHIQIAFWEGSSSHALIGGLCGAALAAANGNLSCIRWSVLNPATGQTPEVLSERLRSEAAQSVARELVLDAVADKLGLKVTDDEIRQELRDAGETDEDIEDFVARGGADNVRDDLRLKKALDRIAGEVKPIDPELAAARGSIWTPEQERTAETPKLWTPGSEE